MAEEPEKRAPRMVEVPLMVMSLPQAVNITADTDDWGNKVAHLQVSWPMVGMIVEIQQESAAALIAGFRQIFGPSIDAGPTLTVARELPPAGNREQRRRR